MCISIDVIFDVGGIIICGLMNIKTSVFLVSIVFALPILACAKGKEKVSGRSTNTPTPVMSSTPEAQSVIAKWRQIGAYRQSGEKPYKEHSHESNALGNEKVYTFAHTQIPGTSCAFSGFVAIRKPRDIREGGEDAMSAGVVITIWKFR